MNFKKIYHEYSGIAAFNAKGSPEKHMVLTWSNLCESGKVTIDHYKEFLDRLEADILDSRLVPLEIIRELGLVSLRTQCLG